MKVVVLVTLLAPTLATAAPTWCGDSHLDHDRNRLHDKDPRSALPQIAGAACGPDASAEVEQVRQEWSKRLGMIDADWADVVAWAQRRAPSSTIDISTKVLRELTPIDQYAAIRQRFHPQGGNEYADWLYIADGLEPILTEVGRLGAIEECILNTSEIVTWAACQGDIDAFDRAKFATQLRSDTAHPPEVRMDLRIALDHLCETLHKHADDVDKAKKSDPAYAKMFDIAAHTRADWAAGIGKKTDLLALVTAMDSATYSQSRSQFEGCEDKTAAALRAAISKLPAKSFAGMNDERNDPYKGFAGTAGKVLGKSAEVQLAAVAFIECQPVSGVAEFLSQEVSDYPGQRGPRSAVLDKLMGEPLQLDDESKKIAYPSIRTRPYVLSHGSIASFGGVVAGMKPSGEDTEIEFAHTSFVQRDCVQEHSSGRISQILGNGTVQYAMICDKEANVTHNNTQPPVLLSATDAKLVKVGVRISVTNAPSASSNHSGGRARRAAPPTTANGHKTELLAIWPNKTATGPTTVLGAALK